MSPTSIAGYLALFFGFGFFFLFVNLLVGRLLRPRAPSAEKLEVYECGEPAIGSSFVQFDLRFYVVALLFIIFDVEVAFFFPWAAVFGKATHLMDPSVAIVNKESGTLTPPVLAVYDSLTVPRAALPSAADPAAVTETARTLAVLSVVDIMVFFAVLLVGFAYVWRRGDLDWVRAMSVDRARQAPAGPMTIEEQETALVG